MADKKIRLLVQAEVKKAIKQLNKVEKEQKDLKKNNDKLKNSFAAIGGTIAAAFSVRAIAQFTAETVRLGSQTIGLEKAFKNLGKGVGFNEQSLQKFRKATDGTVSDIELMKQANNAMLLGIVESDDQFAELIDNAQRLAKAVGKDAAFGIESLTTGIGRQSKLMLDNLGIVLDTNLAYERYAESIGKSTSELDENERKQAFIQAATESTKEKVAKLGEEELTASDATDKLSASFENLKGIIGKDLQDDVETTAGAMTGLVNVYAMLIKEIGFFNLITGQSVESLIRKSTDDLKFAADALLLPSADDMEIRVDVEASVQRLAELVGAWDGSTQQITDLVNGFHDNLDLRMGDSTVKALDDNLMLRRSYEILNEHRIRILAETKKKEKELEDKAHKEKIAQNMTTAILQGQSAKEAAVSVIKAEIMEATAGLVSSIMKALPFPINLAVAAGAGAMIGKVTDKLLSFETGGSFVTKGKTILPMGHGVMVGDNASGMERIDVTPLPSPTTQEGNIVVNINAPVVDEYVVDSIIPAIERARKLNL